AVYEQRGERDEGRVAQVLPVVDLFVEETFVVLRARVAQSVVLRVICLNQDATGQSASARAPCDLRDELERSLRGAEVWQRKPRVNRDDADERDVREVVPLRNHLRADEHVEFARGETQDGLLVDGAARGRVAVEARDAESGGACAQNFFYLLRALADGVYELTGARGARFGHAAAQVAVVADEASLAAMIRQGHVAVRTVDALAARAAQDEARIAAAVQKYD